MVAVLLLAENLGSQPREKETAADNQKKQKNNSKGATPAPPPVQPIGRPVINTNGLTPGSSGGAGKARAYLRLTPLEAWKGTHAAYGSWFETTDGTFATQGYSALHLTHAAIQNGGEAHVIVVYQGAGVAETGGLIQAAASSLLLSLAEDYGGTLGTTWLAASDASPASTTKLAPPVLPGATIRIETQTVAAIKEGSPNDLNFFNPTESQLAANGNAGNLFSNPALVGGETNIKVEVKLIRSGSQVPSILTEGERNGCPQMCEVRYPRNGPNLPWVFTPTLQIRDP